MKSRAGAVAIQETDGFDVPSLQADFLVGLSQCGLDDVGISWINTATGERNLARVLFQGIGALRQQDREFVAQDNRHQHGCVRGWFHDREVGCKFRVEVPIAAPDGAGRAGVEDGVARRS